MFLLSVQNNFYIILSSCVERYMKKISSLNFMSLVGFQASKMWKFFWKIYSEASLQIIFRKKNNSLEPPAFWFSNSLPCCLGETCKSWLVRFWVSRHSKKQKHSANSFSFAFLSCCYGFTNYFEILIFLFFLISYLEVIQPVKYYFSRISTSRNIKL